MVGCLFYFVFKVLKAVLTHVGRFADVTLYNQADVIRLCGANLFIVYRLKFVICYIYYHSIYYVTTY